MSDVLEDKWRNTMTEIFKKLDGLQYKKMVGFYEKPGFPSPTKMTAKFRRELPKKLIEMFGLDGSISLVNKAMKEIPRNDPGVQELLGPFVDKLGENQEKQEAGEFPVTGPVVCIMVRADHVAEDVSISLLVS
ncbi:hypothetical protein XENORESO_000511 [Xenotaenia resolanae]|uniref:Uncharacterized protein n=1 Tax=Xenotaenia resolanae TaxID=208358 RepID=A0ABV0W1V8_9TELE